jgi:hypothetical protein
MLREHFCGSVTIFDDAFLNAVATFFNIALGIDGATRFWRESGMPVYERNVEGVSGSLADYYFGDIFDQYSSDARHLLCPESNAGINSFLRLNSDDLAPVVYLVLFLLGNSIDSAMFSGVSTLAAVVQECQLAPISSGDCGGLGHNQLLGYFDYFSKADPASLPQYIPISQKLNALTHAGLTPAEILDLFAIVHRVKLRVAVV